MIRYEVTLKYQHEREPYRFDVEADSKAEAISKARDQARRDGHYGYGAGIGLGRSVFRALEAR